MGTPSGVTQSWKLWRHCCCRNGFYPVLLLPLVTVGCLLTAYSSTGCRWVELDVGFTPNNEGWEYSSGMKDFGFFYQYDESVVHDSAIRGTFHPGCALHPDPFFENFIEGDRTFKMTRYMALISIASSGVAMVVAWLFVITPLPICFWGTAFLPSIMISFISEGSKFLIFDSSICRNRLFFEGGLLVAEKADSCGFGQTAWFSCAACVLHFWALVCACVRSPEKRILKEQYTMKRFDDENDKIEPDTSDDPDLEGGEEKASEEYDDDKETESDIHGPASSPKYNSGIVGKGDEEQEEVGDDTSTNENSNLNTTTTITPVSANHDLKLSPVDCIMEGFEVASNLANLDGVCSTMICPAPHAIEVEDSDDNVAKIPENKESAETDLVLTARKTEEPEDSSSVEDKQVLTEKEQNGSTNSDAYPGKKEEMDVLP